MTTLRRIRDWFKRRRETKARVARLRAAAREHGRRSLYCPLCLAPLNSVEIEEGYCSECWHLRGESEPGMPRPLGMGRR